MLTLPKMIVTRIICVSVNIPPTNLDSGIEDTIREKAKNLVLGREIKGVGLVMKIESIKNIVCGEIMLNSSSNFKVNMSVSIYTPTIGEVINTKVKDVSIHGYYVDEPIQTFVGTEEKPNIKPGDKTTIKITKIGFNKGCFVVIAKQLS